MADPLRHNSKLDVAEEILDFIANNIDAEEVRVVLRNHLDITDQDFKMAHEIVNQFNTIIEKQEF